MGAGKQKTILFIIGGFVVGGKERQLAELIYNLPKDRYRLHLLVKNHTAYYLEKIQEHLTSFHSLERSNFHLYDFLTIARHIDKVQPDIVCSWTNVTSHFCLLARFFSSQPYTLLNCCIRNAPVQLSAALKFERFMYSYYNNVIANSHAGLKAYGQNGRQGRYVLYNGFDFSRVPNCSQSAARRHLGFEPDWFVVVMVASLTDLKDHETFLRAATECKKRSVRIKFLIVGDGDRRTSLEARVKELDVSSMISFLGRRDDVELIFRAADISVLTSTEWFGEGISNSIIESMACGTPVIASDSPGTREVIVDNDNGYLIDCGDYQRLAERVMELYNNPETIKKASQQAQKCVESKFSIKQLVDNFCRIVESC